uniref:B-cell translocation gene 3 n=1 Tax=Neogobius melanostomus TaxID=47308 RepID=A0A8C6TSP7_9GOBI
MRREIAAAVFFLKRLIKRNNKLESEKIDLFAERFAFTLQDKFKGHWYPENPSKGQAYRCIRINEEHRRDPDILRACNESGIQYSELGLPRELTIWVDPGEVCCRLEENKPYMTVATMSNDDEDDKEVTKKVTSALERVTSDYHSGTSSDEESTRSSPLTLPNRHFDNQASSAAQWNFRRMATGRGHIFPKPQHMSRPRDKPMPNQLFRPHAWIPPALRRPPGYWGIQQGYQQYY